MTVEIQLWHLISLLISFMGCVAGFWKFTEARREKSEDHRWDDLHRHLEARFEAIMKHRETDASSLQKLEREFLRFQASMPLEYVRREDYVRGQSVIEAKLDALYHKIEIVQLKGNGHD